MRFEDKRDAEDKVIPTAKTTKKIADRRDSYDDADETEDELDLDDPDVCFEISMNNPHS